MLLYRVTYTDRDDVVTNEWFPDLGNAMRARDKLNRSPGAMPRIEQIEFPTDRFRLVEWLNTESNTPKYTEEFYA